MIVVVGAGLAGLAAALTVQKSGRPFLVLESTDRPGGRARTFRVQPLGKLDRGYLLDRGFQVVLKAYPAVREFFTLEDLEPRYFAAGAVVATQSGLIRVFNPLQHPSEVLAAPTTPLFSAADKIRLAWLGARLFWQSPTALAARAGQVGELSTAEFLRKEGFSEESVRRFFRPFFGGVLLDASLQTSSGLFLFYLQQFLRGRVFIPREGIGRLGENLAERLEAGRVHYQAAVVRIRWQGNRAVAVQLADGREISLHALILATDEPSTARLLPGRPAVRAGQPVWTFYFATRRPLMTGALLLLNGRGGPIAHLTQLTNLERSWAPEGYELISVTVNEPAGLAGADLQQAVVENLRLLFPWIPEWSCVGQAAIEYAVPRQEPGFAQNLPPVRVGENVWLAGDQVSGASLQGALSSGKSAALALLAEKPGHA